MREFGTAAYAYVSKAIASECLSGIGTLTGEEVMLFTLAELPRFCGTRK
jgi:hypothetical protein